MRELGGYPTRFGRMTVCHRFLRADALFNLTGRDIRLLHDHGVRTVIDLRDEREASLMPDVRMPSDVLCVNAPLFPTNVADATGAASVGEGRHLGHLYRQMLGNQEALRACLRLIADAPEGCVLFHCAVGKDRTGILSMLLLGLSGVGRADIVSDYVRSWTCLMRDEAFASDWADPRRVRTRHLMESRPEYIESALDLIEDEWGGAEPYLLACGVGAGVLERVRRRLVQP